MKNVTLGLLLLSFAMFFACKSGFKDFDKKNEDCFKMIYPLSFTFPDGVDNTVASEEEMWADMKVWYEANPGTKEDVEFHYPMQVSINGSTIRTVQNEMEMTEAKKSCDNVDGN